MSPCFISHQVLCCYFSILFSLKVKEMSYHHHRTTRTCPSNSQISLSNTSIYCQLWFSSGLTHISVRAFKCPLISSQGLSSVGWWRWLCPLTLGLRVVSDVTFLTCCPTLSQVDLRSIWSPALSHHFSHRRRKHSVPVCRPNTKSLPGRRRRTYTTTVRRASPTRQRRKHVMWTINTN